MEVNSLIQDLGEHLVNWF